MEGFLFNLPDLRDEDFTAHNAESSALWAAFEENTHTRAPIRLNTNPRVLMLNPAWNPRGIPYEAYMTDPEVMAQTVLEWQYWVRFLMPGDHEKGLPEYWNVHVDLQNFYDAAWFGLEVVYRPGQVPDTEPLLDEDRKHMLFDRGLPEPFDGVWAQRALDYVARFRKKSAAGWTFLGRPVKLLGWPFCQSDGVFTVAASLRGAGALCMDLLADPDYARQLLAFVHEGLVKRITAWRNQAGMPVPCDDFWAADDAVQMLSLEQYREFVLPLHRDYYDTFATRKGRVMHLCGDGQRLFETIHRELGVTGFDTGFPIDFAAFRQTLGPEVLLCGGPRVPLFLDADPAPVAAETKRILESGVLEGGRMILQEGNNLAPDARLDTCKAFYEAGKRYGGIPGRNTT